MFQLYVEVEGYVRAVEFVAFAVRTLKLFLDLDRQSSILVLVGGEDLGLLGGNVESLEDDQAYDSSDSLNTQREMAGCH